MVRLDSLSFAALAMLSLWSAFELTAANAPEKAEKEKAELAGKVYTLIKDKCWSCHGEPGKKVFGKIGGEPFNFILDYDQLIENEMIDKERPELSEIYSSMKTGAMPREVGNVRAKKKLPQEDIDLVLNWIKAGAPKWDSGSESSNGQAIKWNEIKGSGPSKRTGHAMSEGPGKSVVLFGGTEADTDTALGDTWVLFGGVWKQLKTKEAPPAGTALRMAFDSKRGVCVLVGLDMSTWEFDGKVWKEVKIASKPPERKNFSIAFDPGQGLILIFGGVYVFRSKTMHSQKPYDDAWTFDGKTWQQLELKNSPSARYGAAMAFSPLSKAMVLFGGADNTNKFADTYLLRNGEWTKQEPDDSPGNAPFLLMASNNQDTVLVCSQTEGLAETWLWKGNGWVKGPDGPNARSGAGIAYDGNAKCILLFGGKVGDTHEDSWWQLTETK